MTVTVYGIREKGSRELRYVGFTRKTPEERLAKHLRTSIDEHCDRPLLPWLRANRNNVEAFAIAKCATVQEARAIESITIALCLRLNHRLLNGAQVPFHLRIAA